MIQFDEHMFSDVLVQPPTNLSSMCPQNIPVSFLAPLGGVSSGTLRNTGNGVLDTRIISIILVAAVPMSLPKPQPHVVLSIYITIF